MLHATSRLLALGAVTVVLVTVAACSATDHHASGALMLGNGSRTIGRGTALHYAPNTCWPATPSPRGTTINVVLADTGVMQMMGGSAPLGARMMLHANPATVAAGNVTFVASNRGWRTHELVILPLRDGLPAGARKTGLDGRVSESGSLGEASSNCAAGAGEGIPSGSASWVTAFLLPGRYELICNLTNHYADGMHQQLVVRP